jgi:outer membrane protein assembly factor BamD (BamD/ComL family)
MLGLKIITVLLVFLLLSCKTINVTYKNLSQKERIEISKHEAIALYDMGEAQSAILILDNLIKREPYHPLMDEIYLKIINWMLEVSQMQQARLLADYFLKNYPKSKIVPEITALFGKKDDSVKLDKEPLKQETKEEIKLEEKEPKESVNEAIIPEEPEKNELKQEPKEESLEKNELFDEAKTQSNNVDNMDNDGELIVYE